MSDPSHSPVGGPLSGPVALMPGWSLSLYPSAGEGGGHFVSLRQRERSFVPRGAARDPGRAAQEAGRRARGRLRRYCAANRLNRLGTLTYAGDGCHDPRLVRADLGAFFRALRGGLGGEPLAYVWVAEWHKSGHGLHAHFAVGRYVPRSLIASAWGHGFVHIKLLGGLPAGSGPVEEARKAAGYLSKYVAKAFTDPAARVMDRHRYDVAQGFQPPKVRLFGRSADAVLDQASALLGGEPARVWSSTQAERWDAPPAIWAQWAG